MQESVRKVDISDFFRQVVGIGNEIKANDPKTPPERLQPLVSLLSNIRPSQAYFDLQDNVAQRLEEYLGGVDWDSAKNIFTGEANEESQAFLQKVTNAMTIIARDEVKNAGGQRILFPAIPVKWTDRIGSLKGSTLFSLHRLDPRRDRISVSEKLESLTGSAGEAIVTATHENWHLVNVALGQAVKSGVIGPSHPLYHDGLYFKHQIDRNAHYTVGAAYKNELDERTAIHFGDRIAWWLQQNCPQMLSFQYSEDGPVLLAASDANAEEVATPQMLH